MSESKLTAAHLRRSAVVYVRQSTLAQIARNRESTTRQYDLVARAVELGWPSTAVRVIDEDLGRSGASAAGRSGFAELAAQVGLGQVGIVLALEVSRLARNNSDWYRLLDLAGMSDTLIADADGVYHPGLFNDRMLLGMKGTMSEAELHILRARLDGGIRNKAARGELRRGLPVGLVWGEADGEIRRHPDETVTGVIAAIFERFAVCGSVRGVWLWLRDHGLKFPLQPTAYLRGGEITWVEPTYHAVHNVLTHPAYAGAYVFGRTRQRRRIDPTGRCGCAATSCPQGEWEVLITDHHEGFIDWDTYQANQISDPRQHPPEGAPARHRRGPRGLRAAAGAGHLRGVRAQTGRLLRRPGQDHPRLLLHRHRSARRGPGHPPPARRRSRDRHRGRRGVPGRAAARRAAGLPGRRPAPRRRPRRRARRNGAASSNKPDTRPVAPNTATAPSTRTTGWSPAAWKPNGTPRCKPSPTPRPNSPAAKPHDRKP